MPGFAAAPTAAPVSRVRHVRSAAGLADVLAPAVDLALWQRRPKADLAGLLDRLDVADLPHLRLDDVAVDAVAPSLIGRLGPGAGPLAALIADIATLARLYGRVLDRRTVRLRLETITGVPARSSISTGCACACSTPISAPAPNGWTPRPTAATAAAASRASPSGC